MKKVHWKIRQRIIAEYEETERIRVLSDGRLLMDVTLAELRAVNAFMGLGANLTVYFGTPKEGK